MSPETHVDVLNNVLVVNIECRLWSGRKKLRPSDLSVDKSQLPPKDLVSLGSRKVFDPEELKPIAACKAELISLCSEVGFPFAKNWAIPRAGFKALCGKMDAVIAKSESLVALLRAEFEPKRQSWKQRHSEYAEIADSGELTREQVMARFYLGYRALAINGVPDQDGDAGESTSTLVSGLAGRLYVEVVKTARQMQKTMVGRETVTNAFLNPVRKLQTKLEGLSFLDAGIEPMAIEIKRVLASLPQKSRVGGNDLHAIRGLLSLLADPHGLKVHAKALGSQAAMLFADEEDDEEAASAEELVKSTTNVDPQIALLVGNTAAAAASALETSASDLDARESQLAVAEAQAAAPASWGQVDVGI